MNRAQGCFCSAMFAGVARGTCAFALLVEALCNGVRISVPDAALAGRTTFRSAKAGRPLSAAPRLNGYRTPGEYGPQPFPPPKTLQAAAGLGPKLTAYTPCDGPARGKGQAGRAMPPAPSAALPSPSAPRCDGRLARGANVTHRGLSTRSGDMAYDKAYPGRARLRNALTWPTP